MISFIKKCEEADVETGFAITKCEEAGAETGFAIITLYPKSYFDPLVDLNDNIKGPIITGAVT